MIDACEKDDNNNDMIYYGLPQLINIMDMYFDKRFNELENNKRNLTKKYIIYYDEQIIKIKKGQRLIIQMEWFTTWSPPLKPVIFVTNLRSNTLFFEQNEMQ